MSKLTIEEVIPKGEVYPKIVNFQNGDITEDFESVKCCVLEDPKTGVKTVATEISGLVYAGEEEEEDLSRTLLLARNRVTGKVRLIEVGNVSMKAVLNIDTESSRVLETSALELSRKFGSKKQKQQLEHREKLKVNTSTVEEQMQNVTENITEDKLDISAYNTTDSDDFYIPPINRDAAKVEDVYDTNDILSINQIDKIWDELEGKDYTSNLIPFISKLITEKSRKRDVVFALYVNSLIQLFTTTVRDIKKKNFTVCPHSALLNGIIMNNFLTNVGGHFNRTQAYKDKAFCYSVVLLLLLSNFKFELEPLCSALKITATTAALKARVTGAYVATVGKHKVVQLKLPLNTKSGFRRKSAKF